MAMQFKRTDLTLLWYAVEEYSHMFVQEAQPHHDEYDTTDAKIYDDCKRLKDRINAQLIKHHGVKMS